MTSSDSNGQSDFFSFFFLSFVYTRTLFCEGQLSNETI